MNTRYKFFVGLTLAAAIPLLAAGIFLEVIAVRKAFAGQGISVLTYLLLGMSLSAIGTALPIVALRAARRGARLDKLQERFPDKPWRWRDDWSSQLLRCGSEFPTGPIFLAALWNISSVGLGLLLYREWLVETDPIKWVVIAIPLIGVLLAFYAVQKYLLWKRFGETRFTLGSLPVPAADLVEGIAYTRIPFDQNPEDGFKVSLSCINEKVRLERMARSRRSYLLWRDERRFRGVCPLNNETGTVIPLYFRLPEDCTETSLKSNDRVTWILKIEADTGIGSYNSEFVLPVFKTDEADDRLVEWADSRSHSASRYAPQPVEKNVEVIGAGIEVDSTPGSDGTLIHLKKARNMGLALLVGLVTTVWWAMTATLFVREAPIYFSVLCAVGGVMALYGSLVLLTFETKITVRRGKIAVRRGPFGQGPLREYNTVNADRLQIETGSRSGRAYLHNITLKERAGDRFLIADQIADKRIAEWLILKIQSEIAGSTVAGGPDGTAKGFRRDRAARRKLSTLNDRISNRITVETQRIS